MPTKAKPPYTRGQYVRFRANALAYPGLWATVIYCRPSRCQPGSGRWRMLARVHNGIGSQVGCMSDQFETPEGATP